MPGDSAIAGTYRGHDEVLAYFRHRRDLARGSFRMIRRVGLYDVEDGRIAACWLLPPDPEAFDDYWVVVHRTCPDEVVVSDPARGAGTLQRDAFAARWSGWCAVFAPVVHSD